MSNTDKKILRQAQDKVRVGILGATGMVGQRFISLLENHPWFEVVSLAASPQSAGKTYEEAVRGRWLIPQSGTPDPAKQDLGAMATPIPEAVRNMKLLSVEDDFSEIVGEVDPHTKRGAAPLAQNSNSTRYGVGVDLVFSAIDADKEKIKSLEERYASAGIAVVSNNSAHRWTADVPMMIPEINFDHLKLIDIQRKNRGWDKGLLVVKPNCSLQSYLPIIYALNRFKPKAISVTTLQAISGAGKNFETWPEMIDNCIPFIGGEEEKTEKEPMKILGEIKNYKLEIAVEPVISATCIRVAVLDGHMASVSVKFADKPSLEQIIDSINNFQNPLTGLDLPSAPKQFLKYFSEENRPQTRLDRDYENGMGITCGRFREDVNGDWKFIALSHNTIRGAAGGAILTAELLYKKGYLK